MASKNGDIKRLQRRYLLGAAAIAPISPLLFLQGQFVRWKVGILPDAAGEKEGIVGSGSEYASLLVIGESTVAGLGARTHDLALAGQFAAALSEHINRPVQWTVIGKNGVTARRTIEDLVPLIPNKTFDYILVGLGGNDVIKLSSPHKWRRDMIELLSILRKNNPDAVIFISNCPMIILSPVLPHPVKGILWELSQMHDANIREFTREMDRVYYYPQPVGVKLEGFFADGIHPSERGYREWAYAMMRHFAGAHKW